MSNEAALVIALRALQEIADTDCYQGAWEDAPLPAWVTASNALQEIKREFYFNGGTGLSSLPGYHCTLPKPGG